MDYSLAGSSVHGISQAAYWSGVSFPSPGDLLNPGIKPASPALAGRFFTTELPGKPLSILYTISIVYTCQSQSLNSSHPPPLSPWYQDICSLCLCLYSCLIWNFFRLGSKELGDFSKYDLLNNLWHWNLQSFPPTTTPHPHWAMNLGYLLPPSW